MQMLVLLLFFSISCLLLTPHGRSFLTMLKFVQPQRQQAKEHYRPHNQKRRKKPLPVADINHIGRKDWIKDPLTQLTSRLSRGIKKKTKFVAIFAIAIIAGHGMSSQLAAQVRSPRIYSSTKAD